MPVTAGGTFWVQSGPPAAPVVVLVHGLGLDHRCWRWMEPELARRFRVVRYDLHGHGQSANLPGQPTLRMLSDQLVRLLDDCSVDSAAIVGFSLGGMIARRFAQAHPERTRALAILHSPHARTPQAQAAIRARVEQARRHGPAATVEDALQRWFGDAFRAARPDLIEEVRGWVLANDPAVYPGYYRILAEEVDEVVRPDPPIACPALAITADEDFGNGPEMSRAIAAEIAGAELIVLHGLRHMALVEAPAAVNRPVVDFLTRALAGPAAGGRA